MAAPLSRTWFDSLVDDTGTGTTGTVWTKAQVDALMDVIDAALVNVADRAGAPAATQIATFADGDTIQGSPAATLDAGQGALALTGGYPGVLLTDVNQAAGQQAIRILNYGAGLYFIALDTLMSVNRAGLLHVIGGVSLANGALTFPAVAQPSAGATTLDDYREGPWTPGFGGTGGGSGQVYAIRQGTYTKVGREVTAYGWLHMAVAGSFTPGPIFISGLPVAAGAMPGVVTFGSFGSLTINVASLSGEVVANSTYATFMYVPPGGGTMTAVPHTAIQAETNVKFRVSYQAAQ